MVEINEKDLSIVVNETLSFENHVQNILDDIRDDVKSNVLTYDDKDLFESLAIQDKDTITSMRKFIEYSLTNEDKIKILENIKEDFEYEASRDYGFEVSLFDEDGIKLAIRKWIEDNFHFDIDEM